MCGWFNAAPGLVAIFGSPAKKNNKKHRVAFLENLTDARHQFSSFFKFIHFFLFFDPQKPSTGNISTVWIAIRVCLWRKRKWSVTSSGTRSGTSRCSTDSWGTRRATTATTATAAARTTASRRTTTASRKYATRCTSARRTCRCTPITTEKTRPSSRKDSSGSAPPRTVKLPTAPSTDSAPPTSTAGGRLATTLSRTRPIWVWWCPLLSRPHLTNF